MQWLGLELAWWFNVGVQIFLCISGFLYGQKNVGETTAFYYRRFKKILIPYYMVFIPYGLLQLVFAKNVFKPKSFIKGLIVNDLLTGAGHLWFVATILLCYVLTPLLAAYRDRFVTNRRSLLLFAFFSLTISTLFFGLFNSFYNPAWICCYIMGYALGINEKYEFVGQKKLLLVYGIVAIVGNCIQIYCLYIENIRFKGWQYFSNYNHVFLGVFLFILMRVIFEKINLDRMRELLSFTDKYSYEIFLVHHLLILGPFSLMSVTSALPLNIMMIAIGTVSLAMIIKRLEKQIFNL